MGLVYSSDHLSLAELKKDFFNYSFATLRADLLAGLNVAFLTLPQAMAYALLANLPLYCGIFAAIYASIIAALFGSSRHLIIGPSNTVAILIQSGTAQILYTYYRDLPNPERDLMAVQILTQLTSLTAILQILAAWCHLGRLTQFVSHSVVVGYIAGTTLAVVINQLFPFFGISRLPGVHSLYENAVYLIFHLHEMQWITALVGLISFGLIIGLSRLHKCFPAALVTIVIAGVCVELLGLSSYSGSSIFAAWYPEDHDLSNVPVIGDTGEIYQLFPDFVLPFVNMRIINGVFPVACAIALLSIIDSTSIAKTIASNSKQQLSTNQEILGVGLGNLASSFIGGMPVSGSPARSCLNYRSGAKTRFSVIFNALFVAFFIYLLSFFVTRIPLATLSALVLVTSSKILKMKQLTFCARATQSDSFVLWTTLLACLFLSLDIAFYIGVTLSIILYLKTAAIPRLAEYTIDSSGELRNIDPDAPNVHKPIRVIKIDGELFFGAADLFQNTLRTFAQDDESTRILILQMKNARDIDATSCFALQQLHDYLQGSNRYLIACGMTTEVWEVLNNSGLVEQIGKDNLFMFDERHPHQHMQQALLRAQELLV